MALDVLKEEINLKRLLGATEQIASTYVQDIAVEAAAASTFYQTGDKRSIQYKSPYVITLFKKYIDEASRMIYELGMAREEWDKAVERQKEESSTSHGPSPSVSPSIGTVPREYGSKGFALSKLTREPPQTENLEEYRRKLSFLANLLNSPRWDLPQHEVSMLKVVRNQRIPYNQQQAELETVAKVQTQVANVLRSELSLPPLVGTEHRSPTAYFGNSSRASRYGSQSESEEWLSQPEAPISPSKKRMTSAPSSPSNSIGDLSQHSQSLGSPCLEGQIPYSSPSTMSESDHTDISFNSDSEDGFASSSFASPRSQSSSTDQASHRPIARQLFGTDSRSSQFETEFGKRSARGMDADAGDLGRLLTADIKMQDELTDELVMYAAAMKDSALNAGLKIRSDTKQLDKMAVRMDTNTHAAQSATSTVKELLNTSTGSIWGNLTMMAMVVLAFIIVWIFIKIVPKP